MINNVKIIDTLAMAVALLTALVLHENAHGIMAYFMGDDTAKNNGRLSLNPLKHLSLIGTLSLFIFKFGWAKPVPINPYKFKNKRLGNFLVSIAGIMTNLILAIIFIIVFGFIKNMDVTNLFSFFLIQLISYLILYNVYLAIFNLIPIPPLDGSKIIYSFLPEKIVYKISSMEQYLNIILIILIFSGAIPKIISTAASSLLSFLFNLLRVF
ncbi:site-2 protease family protein [Miniphocaeibacter halophilus]|uniref:Site-2 protease family protein n=1 Tax=Miniphocaeibacter halophilus TaxID=2931922 RepID=A0AC61MTP3_9FIRM|nr:site-2 protease family protein [Miniphocaeibacter halophilus]QQK07556.1 site-2 protease family protein [Miniphocaeibacter halophilus]